MVQASPRPQVFFAAARIMASPSNDTHPKKILAMMTLVSWEIKGKAPEKCSLEPYTATHALTMVIAITRVPADQVAM